MKENWLTTKNTCNKCKFWKWLKKMFQYFHKKSYTRIEIIEDIPLGDLERWTKKNKKKLDKIIKNTIENEMKKCLYGDYIDN